MYYMCIFFFFYLYVDHRDLHVLTHSFPTRRSSDLLPYLEDINPWISLWAFVLGLAFFVALLNILVAWLRGARASADPWGGTTLEWQTSSPPPHGNFAKEPVVTQDFYLYGKEARA